jgi:hypothetical protein
MIYQPSDRHVGPISHTTNPVATLARDSATLARDSATLACDSATLARDSALWVMTRNQSSAHAAACSLSITGHLRCLLTLGENTMAFCSWMLDSVCNHAYLHRHCGALPSAPCSAYYPLLCTSKPFLLDSNLMRCCHCNLRIFGVVVDSPYCLPCILDLTHNQITPSAFPLTPLESS